MAASRLSLRHLRRFTTTTGDAATTVLESTKISASKAKSILRKQHDPDKALEIYSNVSNHSASPVSSRYAQELTVRRLAKCNRFSDIEALIESHKDDPRIKEEPFYSTLIRSYGRAARCSLRRRWAREGWVGHEDETPRTVSFTHLLTACLNSQNFEKVPQLFDECLRGKRNMEVTTIAFTTILGSLYKNGKVELAESLWNEMVKKGIEFDSAAYNVRLMNAQKEVLREGCWMRLRKCLKGLREQCAPNAATFRTLVFHLCDSGLYEQGYAIFKKSVGMNKIPDFNTLQHLAVGLVRNKKVNDAKG
ncbi:hypothetical protein HID58_031337 [Brassica napus]|uniref:Pentatricopeptide repeat-containing protein n=1 Tax=Brassica napus TaxID=3708 RepID=A0ABQ7XIP9_BRANA|nr:hypothetical protein HID58_031337 [Brassica napus]